MHKYVYVRQFGKNKGQVGRVHESITINFQDKYADELDTFIREQYFKAQNKGDPRGYTITDEGKFTTKDAELADFVRENFTHKGWGDTESLGGKITNDLAQELPSMCKSVIKAIVNRVGSHITDAKIKARSKESNGDFAYIAPSLGKSAKTAQEQAKKRIEVASRNKAVRGYSTSPKSIRKGTVLKHKLLDTEFEVTNVDRINTDGSIDVTYKFGNLGAFDDLKNNPNLKGEDNINLTQEDLMYFDVED